MFRVFDKDSSGALSISELAGMLAELGVMVKENELVGMMKVLDTSGNGVIEFEEFNNFLVVDPYTKYNFCGKATAHNKVWIVIKKITKKMKK